MTSHSGILPQVCRQHHAQTHQSRKPLANAAHTSRTGMHPRHTHRSTPTQHQRSTPHLPNATVVVPPPLARRINILHPTQVPRKQQRPISTQGHKVSNDVQRCCTFRDQISQATSERPSRSATLVSYVQACTVPQDYRIRDPRWSRREGTARCQCECAGAYRAPRSHPSAPLTLLYILVSTRGQSCTAGQLSRAPRSAGTG